MKSLQNLVDTHLYLLDGLADTYEDFNPYKQEFVKHLLRDYLYDINASYNEASLDEMISRFGSEASYRKALDFDISHLSLIKSVASQVYDNNRNDIDTYSYDPTETIDISQDYLDEFYNTLNEYLKQYLTSTGQFGSIRLLNKERGFFIMTKDDMLEMLDGWIFTLEDVAFSDALNRDINFEYNAAVSDSQTLLDTLGIDINDYDYFDALCDDVSNAIDDWDISERLDGLEYTDQKRRDTIMGFTEVLTLIFIVLKLMGIIAWSWWLVWLPELIALVPYTIILIVWVVMVVKMFKH